MSKTVTPYTDKDASKKEQVTEMFDAIAPTYDRLNHLLTFGIDILWRKKAIRTLKPYQPKQILDIATGTGDFAVEAMRLNPDKVVGLDISPEMLRIGDEKMKKKGIDHVVEMVIGDSEALQFPDHHFDAITVGFGVRNFENLEKGLGEMLRVLRPGGVAAVLEPAYPSQFPLKQLFNLHFRIITPMIGKLMSGDNAAYKYLPDSVKAFPNGKEFVKICDRVGYKKTTYFPLTFGACAFYLMEK